MPLTRADIAGGAHQLLAEGYGLFLASNGAVLDQLDTAPFGISVATLDFLKPTRPPPEDWSVADLMRVYNVLNATSFGEKGIPLQNWVMIDLGLLPSAFLLVTLSADRARAAMTEERGYASDRRAHRGGAGRRPGRGGAAGLRRGDSRRRLLRRTHPNARRVGRLVAVSAIPGLGTITKGLGLEVYGRTRPAWPSPPIRRCACTASSVVCASSRRCSTSIRCRTARLPHRRSGG